MLTILHTVFCREATFAVNIRIFEWKWGKVLVVGDSHIGCIWLTFLHCAFSYVHSNCLPERMHSTFGYVWLTFPHSAKCLLKWSALKEAKSHWLLMFDFSPLCIFMCSIKWPLWENACNAKKDMWRYLADIGKKCRGRYQTTYHTSLPTDKFIQQ